MLRAADGVEAMLEIQRKLPRAVVLSAELPKMFGFQICEILKRNASLQRTWVVLVGAIHHPDRYRREADELYGADAYLEEPRPAGRPPPAARQGRRRARRGRSCAGVGAAAAAPVAAPRVEAPAPRPAARPAPQPAMRAARRRRRPGSAAARARARAGRAAPATHDGLEEERAKAERLARIIVSDIVLYNEEHFTAAARAGNVLEALSADLPKAARCSASASIARVRGERDHLRDELLRIAKLRGMR